MSNAQPARAAYDGGAVRPIVKPAFIIAIDVEGDDIWARPGQPTTENARFLPRFQALCQEFGFKPSYLVNHEMAVDPAFQTFARPLVRTGEAEVGLHIHPWSSPPNATAVPEDAGDHVYMFEISDDLLQAKIEYLTDILRRVFEIQPMSHRAGRWGFDSRVARALLAAGYRVDCSVTPGVSWKKHLGAAKGSGGTDYHGFPLDPYFLDLDDIRRPGQSSMLEVPVTIRSNFRWPLTSIHHRFEKQRIGKFVRWLWGSPFTWLRPNGRNGEAMRTVVDWAVARGAPVLQFMLHSSELMPGGSPTFRRPEQVESLYEDMRRLFERAAAAGCEGRTLAEFMERFSVANKISQIA